METKYVRVKGISFDISDDFGFEVDVFNALEIEKAIEEVKGYEG